jgi:hypothetical protein
MEGMKTAAINLTLIKTSPQELKRRMLLKKALEAKEADGLMEEAVNTSDPVCES